MKIAPDYHNLCKLSEDKKSHVKELFGNVDVERETTLKVFFDDSAITEDDCRSPEEYGDWSNKGLYIPLHAEHQDMPERPRLIFYGSGNYKHGIWIKCDVCAGEAVDFVWTLAHELRHFEQDVKSHTHSRLGNLLCDFLLHDRVPREIDADLYAWGRSKERFDNEKIIDDYMKGNSLTHLQGYDLSYNLVKETVVAIEEPLKNTLKNILNERPKSGRFDIDQQLGRLKKCQGLSGVIRG